MKTAMHFQIIKDTNINFVKFMKYSLGISLLAILISLSAVLWRGGLNLGIDFAGGILVQVKFAKEVSVNEMRSALQPIGYDHATIQKLGEEEEFVIRIKEESHALKDLANILTGALEAGIVGNNFEIRRVEVVGPKVGKTLINKALWAVVLSWLGILAYIALRFEFRFGLGGIVALVHDTIITIGALSLLNKEFDLTIVAALLTVIGYSINDTIIIFDRIRENMAKNGKMPLVDIVNKSINETLSRTIIVSLTVIIVLVSLFFLGGTIINNFAYTLIVGVIVGTYSSIFVASPLVLVWEGFKNRKGKK